jgi:hypothetical protein
MAHRASWRSVRRHRNYSVDDASRALGVAKGTVRRWLKGGLPALTERQPALILGDDLIAFLKARIPAKQTCRLEECFCLSCRKPRRPAFDEIEVRLHENGGSMVTGLCSTCSAVMNKRVSADGLSQIRALLTVLEVQADGHISKRPTPCSNAHNPEEPKTHA